jgi:hypothetical protein
MPDLKTGTVLAVLVARDPRSLASTPQPEVNVTFEGFEGDLHADLTRPADGRKPFYPRGTLIRNDRQVSLVSVEELAQVATGLGLPEIRPEWLGANLLLGGFAALTLLPPSTRLFFASGAVLLVSDENLPCSGPGKLLQAHFPASTAARDFPRAALHKRGLVAVVERPGRIRQGDSVTIMPG